MGGDVLFGGPGHDLLYGGYGVAGTQTQLYGGDGDDEIVATYYGNNEIFGGNGDDMILGGILDFADPTPNDATNGDGGLGYMPLLPRESIMPVTGGTIRSSYGSYGELDIDGGAGNDFIVGGVDDDDIYGGEGDDVIYGEQPLNAAYTVNNSGYGDDQIDGGKGDDIIFGVSMVDEMLLEGGEGNDKIYPG